MKAIKGFISFTISFVFLAAVLVLNLPKAFGSQAGQDTTLQSDRQIKADLAREFNKNRFKNVQVKVNNEVIDLGGTVEIFADKEEAEKKAHHAKNAIAVRNRIVVAGSSISDQDLQSKLAEKLTYDRVGYGSTLFNAIGVQVRGGVVTLRGHAYSPTDKYSALTTASYTPGVQDVVDEIEVDPLSPMDDRIRLNVARLIYGYPSLMKYSIDPAKPIRISVQNGKVTLYGKVDNPADRETAFIRANSAQGVFRVNNELTVENQVSERE
jgi:hyperosmotically inducible periplasmic protein